MVERPVRFSAQASTARLTPRRYRIGGPVQHPVADSFRAVRRARRFHYLVKLLAHLTQPQIHQLLLVRAPNPQL